MSEYYYYNYNTEISRMQMKIFTWVILFQLVIYAPRYKKSYKVVPVIIMPLLSFLLSDWAYGQGKYEICKKNWS